MEKSMISCRGWKRLTANVPEEGGADEHEQLGIAESYKPRRTKFDIFINHRGPDGKAFASHLEEALNTRGYAPFFDQNGLGQGEHFPEAIKAAIQDACVHLAIFTPLYAESKYCLDELADMVECVKKDSHGTVKLIPIFLKVTPSNLRCVERGRFQEAFEHHKQRNRGSRIPVWKEALHDAADMMGFEGDKFKNECELKNAIIHRVEEIMDSSRVDKIQWVPTHIVGCEEVLRSALKKLESMGDNVAILGIWGVGGIGKTTLAKKLYNHYLLQRSFGYQAFLELGKGKDVVHLQNQVLELHSKNEKNVVETYQGYLNKLVSVRALVVADDISYGEHFTKLVPDLKKLGGGSRIILTSRDKDVLDQVFREAPEAYYLLEMEVLNSEDSLELFCVHAFLNKSIPNTKHPLYPLAKIVADMCRGLPLALEMIGKHLYNRSEGEWEEEARELSLSTDVLDTLSMSYKGLRSKSDKMMFLDVACHMVGLRKEDAIDIWESCASGDSNPPCRRDRCLTSRKVKGSLQTLVNKSLVRVCYNGRLRMHGLIQEMGRKMVQDEWGDEKARGLGQYRHLWDAADVENVLNENEGTKEVRGLSLIGLNGKPFMASAFRNMTEIHFLLLDGVRIDGDFSQMPKKIRWMQWRNACLSSLPLELHCSNLVVLDLSNSQSLTQLWAEHDAFQVPKLLKTLILEKCTSLEKIPERIDFLTRLRILDLRWCKKLTSLPKSLGELKGLVSLKLKGCKGLVDLPDSVVKLRVLQTLSMDRCVKIRNLPANFGNLVALVRFSAVGASSLSALPELPKSVKELSHLREFYAEDTAIRELPSDLGDLKRLFDLSLAQCNQLESLPDSFGDLQNLSYLHMKKNQMTKLPCSFKDLTNLKYLNMQGSPYLVDVESLPVSLEHLELGDCPKVVRVSVKQLLKLRELTLCNCTNLTKLEGVEHAESLEILNVSGCCSMSELQIDLFKSTMTHCYVNGSGVSVKYNNDWNKAGAPSLQVVSYYDHAMGFIKNSMTRKISVMQYTEVLCMETGIMGSGVAAVVITVVAHDQGWSHYIDLDRPSILNLFLKGRIVRSEEGSDVEVFKSELFSLRQADHRDQVYICTLRRSHPLIQSLKQGDKLRVCALSNFRKLEITVMQGHIHVAYKEGTSEDPFQNLLLRDNLSSSFRPQSFSKVCQAFTQDRCMRFTIKNSDGDLPVGVFRRDVYQPVSVQVNGRGLLSIPRSPTSSIIEEHAIGLFSSLLLWLSDVRRRNFDTQGRICDMCNEVIYERGYHCKTCVDFDMCQSCKEVKQTVHPSAHLFTVFEVIGHKKNWGYVVDDLWWSENFPTSSDSPCATMRRIYAANRSSKSNPNNMIGYIVDMGE